MNVEEQAARERILSSAARIFGEKGFHGTSIREIAEAAEVSLPMLYYYFGSKEGLYNFLLLDTIDRMQQYVTQSVPKDISPRERLVRIAAAFATFYSSNRHLFRLISIESTCKSRKGECGFPTPTEECIEFAASSLKLINDIVKRGIELGDFREVDPEITALMLLGTIYLLIEPDFALVDNSAVQDKIPKIFDILMGGIERS